VSVVLDSWAVLRFLEGVEPAASAVNDLLEAERPLMSWINLGEVFYVIRRVHGEGAATVTVRDVREVVDCVLPDAEDVLRAGRIKSEHPLAYADAFAAAAAVAHGSELWTGDPELLVDASQWRWRDLRVRRPRRGRAGIGGS
jgi:predicted nucleic acid-binding protein